MPRQSIRNKHGDLTKYALETGYTEQAAWINVGMESHMVQLELAASRPAVKFRVIHRVRVIESLDTTATSWDFTTLTEARACFKRESKR